MSGVNLPLTSLKHIQSFTFTISPLAQSAGARSLRLLLSRVPSKLPAPTVAQAAGIVKLPEVQVQTTHDQEAGMVQVVYSDKTKLDVKLGSQSGMGIAELIRRIEGPAKALRLKEQGV